MQYKISVINLSMSVVSPAHDSSGSMWRRRLFYGPVEKIKSFEILFMKSRSCSHLFVFWMCTLLSRVLLIRPLGPQDAARLRNLAEEVEMGLSNVGKVRGMRGVGAGLS